MIEMASYEGLSMQEIAVRTNSSFASVRHRYYRGLQKLRSLISGEGDTRPSQQEGEKRLSLERELSQNMNSTKRFVRLQQVAYWMVQILLIFKLI